MLKETRSLLNIIQKKIPAKSHVTACMCEDGLKIVMSIGIDGRHYAFYRIFSNIEIHDFHGSDEHLVDSMCDVFKRRVRHETERAKNR